VNVVVRDGETKRFEVTTASTGAQLVQKIVKEDPSSGNENEPNQLWWQGDVVPADVELFKVGCNLNSVANTKLYFNPESFPVFMKLPNGQVKRFMLNPAMNIYGLKKQIDADLGFPRQKIHKIVYAGKTLEDDLLPLYRYDIEQDGGATLEILEKEEMTGPKTGNKWKAVKATYVWGASTLKVDYGEDYKGSGFSNRKSTVVRRSTVSRRSTRGASAISQPTTGGQQSETLDEVEEEDDEVESYYEKKHDQHQQALKLQKSMNSLKQQEAAPEKNRAFLVIEDEGYVEPEEISVQGLFSIQPKGKGQSGAVVDPDQAQMAKVRKGDLDYHLLSCCMCCCPCLRPKPYEIDSDDEDDVLLDQTDKLYS